MTSRNKPPAPPSARLRVVASDPERAEIAAAEAWEHGAEGVVVEPGDCALTIYCPPECGAAIGRALCALEPRLEVSAVEPVEDVEWSEAWKQVLGPVEVSARLVVRPPFAAFEARAGQRVIVIEPGQAFGTGAHHSTRLALECTDLVCHAASPARVLDVGTGSGVLALAALALGAGRATAFDLDPLAGPATRSAAVHNGLLERLDVYIGPIEALAGDPFELVVANLLRRELLPIASEVGRRVAVSGHLVLAGLLAGDVPPVLAAFAPLGLLEMARRERVDDDGESWVGLVLRRS